MYGEFSIRKLVTKLVIYRIYRQRERVTEHMRKQEYKLSPMFYLVKILVMLIVTTKYFNNIDIYIYKPVSIDDGHDSEVLNTWVLGTGQ